MHSAFNEHLPYANTIANIHSWSSWIPKSFFILNFANHLGRHHHPFLRWAKCGLETPSSHPRGYRGEAGSRTCIHLVQKLASGSPFTKKVSRGDCEVGCQMSKSLNHTSMLFCCVALDGSFPCLSPSWQCPGERWWTVGHRTDGEVPLDTRILRRKSPGHDDWCKVRQERGA